MKKLVLTIMLLIALMSSAFYGPIIKEPVTVSLGEVVDEHFFQCIDSFFKGTVYGSGRGYDLLDFYAYKDSLFRVERMNTGFNVDSLYWIAIDWSSAIAPWNSTDYYLVRYNKIKYLIPKNIVKHGNIVRPIGKKRRIDQEYELTLYYHPTLILWHPDGSIVEIPDTTDLYMPLVE